MTLNVIIENFVAVDCEVSTVQRTSDDVEKSEIFTTPNAWGVLVGNGHPYVLQNAISFLRETAEIDLPQLMINLERHLQLREDKSFRDYLAGVEDRIRTKHSLVPDQEKREVMIAEEYGSEVTRLYDGSINSPAGELYVIAYDNKMNKLKKSGLTCRKNGVFGEIDLVHTLAAGSGGDIAGAYLSTQTSGVDWKKITDEFKFYLTALACATATANKGVGGFMGVVIVDQDGARYVEPQRVNAAVRVCGKQVAGDISKREAMVMAGDIFNGKASYFTIARDLGITKEDLLYAPCRVHQDVSRFNAMLTLSK